MTNFRFNRVLLFVLVTAFLSMQWASAHIHLAEHHDHDGSHHQHEVEVHAHQSITQDDNSSISAHQIDNHNVNVVEIDHPCNTKSGNHFNDQCIALISDDFHLSYPPLRSSIEPAELNISKLRYIDYSTIYARAPPKTS